MHKQIPLTRLIYRITLVLVFPVLVALLAVLVVFSPYRFARALRDTGSGMMEFLEGDDGDPKHPNVAALYPTIPVERRCPWRFPLRASERSAMTTVSGFWESGYSPAVDMNRGMSKGAENGSI